MLQSWPCGMPWGCDSTEVYSELLVEQLVKGWVTNGLKVARIEIGCSGGFEDVCGELLLGRDMVRLAVAMGHWQLVGNGVVYAL